jgi:polyhydroxyalkanoate synthesis repressor PhaR
MEEPRIIKKYPNRRLYDTEISRYITLDEVKDLVIKRTVFKIIDDRTSEDMTNYVLIQILAQEENGTSPLFTAEILKGLICFYGNPLQKAMSQFLEKGLSLFSDPELNFHDYLQHIITKDHALNKIASDARQGIDMWGDLLAKYLAKNTTENSGKNPENPPSPK